VAFDASILNLATVTFGTHMGIFTLTGLGPIAVGINVFEISLEPPATLDALQPDSFTLFTLTFDALAAGTSGLTANVNALADAFGGSLDATTEDGSVTVPEPATLGLLGAGLIGIAWRRRRKA
jgi:hypothetical protein